MGLLDIPAPLFSALDGFIGFLPETLRLILWGCLGASVSMWLYLKLSKQQQIGEIKTATVAARKALSGYDGTDFDEMMPLATRVLSLSGKHFFVVLGPAILSSLPALALIVWVSNQFGFETPESGAEIAIAVTPASSLTWSSPAIKVKSEYLISWPVPGEKLLAYDSSGSSVFSIDGGLAPLMHKKTWWNSLIANPAGYLAESAPFEYVQLKLKPKHFLPFGPNWLRDWAGLFFGVLLAVSIGIKVIFKIN